MKKSTVAFALITSLCSASLLGCKTYYIPVDSLEKQLRSSYAMGYGNVEVPLAAYPSFYKRTKAFR